MAKRRRGNNEGSIYKMQDGRWRAAVTTGRNADGKPKRKVFTAATRHEVKDQLTDALKDVRLGIPIVTEKQTIAEFLIHWLDQSVKARVRPKTLRTYCDFVRKHIAPAIGEVALGKLSAQRVREFLNAKLEAGLSPRTVKHLLVTLRSALAVAVKDGQIRETWLDWWTHLEHRGPKSRHLAPSKHVLSWMPCRAPGSKLRSPPL
jgi:integrase